MEDRITRTFFSIGPRKYIGINGKHIKVPWRYNRVMCKVHGIVPIQDFVLGQKVRALIEYVGEWPVLKEVWTE
jgi:hypothetical protein